MDNQKIDVTLSAENVQAVFQAIDAIYLALDFLVGLTPEQRREMAKAGRKSQAFIDTALEVAAKHPNLMPGCLDVAAASRDVQLVETLQPIAIALSQLSSLVEDTQRIANSEAYAAARLAYQSIKTNGKGMGLDAVIEDLKRQFRRSARRPASTAQVQAS
ncbi:hypothetical protein C7271_22895 [filamentous cyanobacterium CCP5]|nr:hypothetical protein C7271_22895 [filamentous cyanobacterium CCP5]